VSLNRVPPSAGIRAGMSPLPGGRYHCVILCGIAFVLCYWCRGQWHNWCSLRLGTEAVQYAPSIFAGRWRTGLDVKMLCTHTRLTHTFNGPFVQDYPGEPIPRDSEWQWHQLGHMQVCTSLQTDNHASNPPLSFYRPDVLPAAQPTASKH